MYDMYKQQQYLVYVYVSYTSTASVVHTQYLYYMYVTDRRSKRTRHKIPPPLPNMP